MNTSPNPPPTLCCPPLLQSTISPEALEQLAAALRALGEPTHLQILRLIAAQPQQAVYACALVETLGLSQPTVSHHLKVLYEGGLLRRERRGTWIYYHLVPDQLAALRHALT